MSVREYLSTLPDQPMAVRRRFAVIGTALSFAVLVSLWMGTRALGRRVAPSASPSAPAVTPAVSVQDSTSAPDFSTLAPVVPSSGVSVEDLSADLLKALKSPRPTP